MNELTALRDALQRERAGRREAERLLETRSFALFRANEKLRRQAAACVEQMQQREAALFHESPIASFEAALDASPVDAAGEAGSALSVALRVRNINLAALELSGCADVEAFERAIRRYVRCKRAKLADATAALQAGAKEIRLELSAVGAEGRRLRVLVHARPLNAVASTAFVITLVDVTDRVTAEREARRARRQAERASANKSDFLAAASHDIRTPLNAVVGLAQVLEASSNLGDEARDQVRIIRESADGLTQILNDILDFGRIEAGRLDLDFAPVDVERLLRSVETAWRPTVQKKGLGLDVSIDGASHGLAVIDDGRVRQMLDNLISNAVKFTEHGQIAVHAALTESEPGTGRLRLIVEDEGCGMSAQTLARLWRPFEQADGSTWREHGGSGLGLSIVHKLAERMGGSATAESRLGAGSTFTIELPCRLETAPRCAPVETPPAPQIRTPDADTNDQGPPRILAAEDNPLAQRVLAAMLDALGFAADFVSNGLEAVEAARSQPYDIVLMDILMPRMNGVEATKAIRALGGAAADLPIIAVTADAMTDQRRIYLDAGMDDVIPKPINGAVLARTLTAWAARRRAEVERQAAL